MVTLRRIAAPVARGGFWRGLSHRAFNELDGEACRRVLSGAPISAAENPGLRLETRFVSEDEAKSLELESRELDAGFGFDTNGTNLKLLSLEGSKDNDGDPRRAGGFLSRRTTGRPEGQQNVAPWGYGDDFQMGNLTPALRHLVEKIQAHPDYDLGPARDVTINYRTNGFFRLDPHLDPARDGPTVFILGTRSRALVAKSKHKTGRRSSCSRHGGALGLLSDVVLTFVPANSDPSGEIQASFGSRSDPVTVGRASWSNEDIDVLLQQRSLVCFSDDARSRWGHAIRGGLEIQEADGSHSVLDWWGRQDFLLRRNPERLSIVVAFG